MLLALRCCVPGLPDAPRSSVLPVLQLLLALRCCLPAKAERRQCCRWFWTKA